MSWAEKGLLGETENSLGSQDMKTHYVWYEIPNQKLVDIEFRTPAVSDEAQTFYIRAFINQPRS